MQRNGFSDAGRTQRVIWIKQGQKQRIFNAYLRINIIEIPPLFLRYDNGVENTKTGVPVPIEEEMAASVSLLLLEIK